MACRLPPPSCRTLSTAATSRRQAECHRACSSPARRVGYAGVRSRGSLPNQHTAQRDHEQHARFRVPYADQHCRAVIREQCVANHIVDLHAHRASRCGNALSNARRTSSFSSGDIRCTSCKIFAMSCSVVISPLLRRSSSSARSLAPICFWISGFTFPS